MSLSKLSTTLSHDNLATFFKMTKLLHFCNKIENCLHHLFLNSCQTDRQTDRQTILPQDKLEGLSIDSIQQQPKHKICEDIADAKATSFFDKLTSMEDAAIFCSLQGQGAGAWLAATPSSKLHYCQVNFN